METTKSIRKRLAMTIQRLTGINSYGIRQQTDGSRIPASVHLSFAKMRIWIKDHFALTKEEDWIF